MNKAYFGDISITGTSLFKGNISTEGTLNIGASTPSNAVLFLSGKNAIRGVDSWLRINDTSNNFTSGIYFGNSLIRTDKEIQVGSNGEYFRITSSSLAVKVPSTFTQKTTHNAGLASTSISSSLISLVKNGNAIPKIDGADASAILNELTVLSTLRAKEYELDHVQNLGGTFMVSPSFICTEGSTTVTVSAISGSEVTFLIKDDVTLTKTEIATASWVLNSQIKLSGKIGNTILANATGTITKSVDTNNHTITVKVDVGSSTVSNFTVNTTYSGSQVSKLALMMFRNASGYRLGIYLESYSSENKKPVINIFDGSGTNPKVVLGKLDGSPQVNSISPTGYGLYSDNAFLKGTIIATSGTIGGFTLSTNSIQNGTFGQDGSVMMCLGSSGSASIGGSGSINGWTFTAGSKFGVTKNGAMYASNATITGNITATSGTIGGCSIKNNVLQIANANVTSIDAGKITSGTISAARIASRAITADKIAIGDFTNYADLNENTATKYGFTIVQDDSASKNPWFQLNTLRRDTPITPNNYEEYNCNGGESFKIEAEVYSTVTGKKNTSSTSVESLQIGIGLYGKKENNDNYWLISYVPLNENNGKLNTYVTLADNVKKFGVNIQINGNSEFSGILKVRNIKITRMTDNSLIVNGSITTNKITTDNITGTNGWINLRSGLFDYGNGKLKWDGKTLAIAGSGTFAGEITAKSGKIGKYTITDNWLITGTGSTCTGIGGNQAFWAGLDDSNDAPFRVGYDGALYSSNANISGKINATSGKIGKFSIDSYALITGDTDSTSAGIGSTLAAFWTGSKDPMYAPFAVTYDGTLHTIKGDIGGWTIEKNAIYKEYDEFGVHMRADPENPLEFITVFNDKATSGSEKIPFYVYSNGYVHASLGDIGNWNIDSSSIYKGSGWKNSTEGSAYFGDEGLSITDNFWVDKTGSLFSNKGKIGGWDISETGISSYTSNNNIKYMLSLFSSQNNQPSIRLTRNRDYDSDYSHTTIKITDNTIGLGEEAHFEVSNETTSRNIVIDSSGITMSINGTNEHGKVFYETSYTSEGIKFNSGDSTTQPSIVWNPSDSTILIDGNLSLNNKSFYLNDSTIHFSNNKYIYSYSSSGAKQSILGLSSGNNIWLGDYGYNGKSKQIAANAYITANNVYKTTSSGSTSLSDERYKHDFKDIDLALDFVMNLNPCLFKFNDGTSNRYHMGFKAQEVERNMLNTIGDTGLTVKYNCEEGLDVDLNNPDTYMLGLRYEEFIAPLVQVVQNQQKQITELKKKIIILSNEK